jgi:predicted transcriptional regulator YdeE
MNNVSILILSIYYLLTNAVYFLVQATVDLCMLSKLLQIEQKNSIQIKELLDSQNKIESKLNAQHDQLAAILNKLKSDEVVETVGTKEKKSKVTEEFYQVNIPILVYIIFQHYLFLLINLIAECD